MNCPYFAPTLYKELLNSMYYSNFFSGYTHWLCREYNYCVFVCTEWRRECTTALYISEYMSETILPDKVDIYTGTDIARIE